MRAGLGEAVLAPQPEDALAVVGRGVVDVEPGPVGDDALERDQLGVGGGPLELGDERVLELPERRDALAQRGDRRLDPGDAMDGRGAVGREILSRDGRLRIPLVVDETGHVRRVHNRRW